MKMDTQSTNLLTSQDGTSQQSDDASKGCLTPTSTDTSKDQSNSQQSGVSSLPRWIALTQQDVLESRMVGVGRFAADMIDICKGVENIDNTTMCQIVASLARLAEEHAELKAQ
jgi:hypothetical protein